MKNVNGAPSSYIYLLKNNEEVVYVGQSVSFKSLLGRIHTHRSSKVFDGFSFIKTNKEDLDAHEATTIVKYSPKYNCNLPIIINSIATVG